jgi:uncharacterized protein (TIGR00369 family)
MLDPNIEQALLQRIHRIPIVSKLAMHSFALSPGRCQAVIPYDPSFDGVFESFHGGILMTIADSVACFAILTETGPDQILTTTDMNIRFLAPCLGDVRADARTIKVGKTLCPVAVDLFDPQGTHVAVAQINYILLSRMPGRGH